MSQSLPRLWQSLPSLWQSLPTLPLSATEGLHVKGPYEILLLGGDLRSAAWPPFGRRRGPVRRPGHNRGDRATTGATGHNSGPRLAERDGYILSKNFLHRFAAVDDFYRSTNAAHVFVIRVDS